MKTFERFVRIVWFECENQGFLRSTRTFDINYLVLLFIRGKIISIC